MSENGSKDVGAGTGSESGALEPTTKDGTGTPGITSNDDGSKHDTGSVEKAGPTSGKHELESSQSRTGLLWTALAVAGVVLVFLLIFVAQNFVSVTVHFLGLQFSLPLGLALLFAAIIGGVLVWLAGTARMIQMRRAAKKARKQS
ncbi:lipopolysaccharide assembly protein LapA domain-containing protein [Saccharopolyspora sp. ID03-671]|uniref:LapA family protein n=1 Tax=Saccharopolyspora sp. ID03-671 TaxID=3073066 RepID=UPI003251B178